MKRILLLIIILISTQISNGIELNFRNNIIITNQKFPKDTNQKFDKLVFGLDERATIYLDTALGELELFPSHPPSGLHAVFEIPEKDKQGLIWSYTDIRPITDEERFEVTYTINIQKDILDTLRFRWQKLPMEYLDSAVICDNILGTLFRINMLERQEAVSTNIGLSKFLIKLWINKVKVNVKDEDITDKLELQIKPNPAKDIIRLNINDFNYRIYNINGELILEGSQIAGIIDISKLKAGFYYIITSRQGKSYRGKFIKF